MNIARPDLFDEFQDVIRTLPMRERFERNDLLIPSLQLYREHDLEMYYAPFGAVNPSATVALVGITPGWTQMEIAYRSARRDLELGLTGEQICLRAKQSASFAGTMRTNLVKMLDELGLPALLGIPSTSELFGSATALVHTTSAVRYPVFVNGQNYSGHSPKILRNAFLRECVETMLAPELGSIREAVMVPLGNAASEVLEHLADGGHLARESCLFGFPHPSGANGRRVRDFVAHRLQLAEKVEWHFRSVPYNSAQPVRLKDAHV
jgi:hypothetical protein